MKSLQTLLVAAVAALALSACGEKKTTGDIIAKKPEAKAASGPVKMQDSRFMEEVKWKDKSCYVNIVRRADTSLPVVKDDAGGQYYDNVIDVTIESHKEDGAAYESKPIFQKTFGKQDFASQVDEKYLEKSALLGVVYDHVDGDNIVYSIVTTAFRPAGAFTIEITVGADKKISAFEIKTNGSTAQKYIDMMPANVKDGSLFKGKTADELLALVGGADSGFTSEEVDASLHGGATRSSTLCAYAALFAVSNYSILGGAE